MWGKCIQCFVFLIYLIPEESSSWNLYTSAVLISYIVQAWPDIEFVVQGMETSMDELVLLCLSDVCWLRAQIGSGETGVFIFVTVIVCYPLLLIWACWSDHLLNDLVTTQCASSAASEWLTWRASTFPCKFIRNMTARKDV